MCQQISEGIRWNRCGHFQRSMVVAIFDCNSHRCERSIRHPKTCDCKAAGCKRNFGQQVEKDIESVDEWCHPCKSERDPASIQRKGSTSSSGSGSIRSS